MKKIIFFAALVYLLTASLIIYYSKNLESDAKEQTKIDAIAYFELMLDTRKWNAAHGGVYVKEHANIKPNKYLRDNILKTDDNQTLVKINPAWMTKQISKISNSRDDYYFHITSLNPINPNNKADEFETKALKFFEKNKDKKHYYSFSKDHNGEMKLDFIGALKTDAACLQCHAEYGDKEGDIRGGIRVTVPMMGYNEKIQFHKKIKFTLLFIVTALFGVLFILIRKYSKEIQTREQHEKALLVSSKQASLGQMASSMGEQWNTPLSKMSMLSSNILVDIELDSLDKEELKRQTSELHNSIQELSQMMMTFSDMFTQTSTRELLPLYEIQKQLCDIINESSSFQGIEIIKDWQSNQKVLLYKNEFMQACYLILMNAQETLTKTKTKNPKVYSKTWDEGDKIHYTLCDNGGTVAEEDLSKLFEPSFDSSSMNRRGLSLSIVKSLIEDKHDAVIKAQNRDGNFCIHMIFTAHS